MQALSSLYVERRERLQEKALEGRGKRAAFALFYGPLHFLTVRAIVRAREAASPPPRVVLDLGCGTGAAGAAWALEGGSRLEGVERNAWATGEARSTLSELSLKGRVVRGDLLRAALPGPDGAVVAAWSVNELDDRARASLLQGLLSSRARVLVVEPIARRPSPWWDDWASAFQAAGGRADQWRFPIELPEILARFDRAAHLDHRVLAARSLWRPAC